jgi:hypothetical protein
MSRNIIPIRGSSVPPVRTIKKKVKKYCAGLCSRLNSACTEYFASLGDALG